MFLPTPVHWEWRFHLFAMVIHACSCTNKCETCQKSVLNVYECINKWIKGQTFEAFLGGFLSHPFSLPATHVHSSYPSSLPAHVHSPYPSSLTAHMSTHPTHLPCQHTSTHPTHLPCQHTSTHPTHLPCQHTCPLTTHLPCQHIYSPYPSSLPAHMSTHPTHLPCQHILTHPTHLPCQHTFTHPNSLSSKDTNDATGLT